MAITSVKIHPAIGIARVGNSPNEFFIGPEIPGKYDAPPGGYKDAQCRVKRQAARFRIFGYDQNGALVQELTAADAEIEWTVHLVNKKAATGRNANVPAADMTIDPGARTIKGPNKAAAFDNGKFKLPNQSAVTVPLGEIRTDVDARLLVLGGFGKAASPTNAPIGSFLDNNNWYDDVSDGPVTAKVKLNGTNTTLTATGAWIIVAPPKFAPQIDSVITLYDTLLQFAIDRGFLSTPSPVSYVKHIYPILQRAFDAQWVNASAAGHHSFVHPITNQGTVDFIFGKLKGAGGNMPQLNSGGGTAGDLTPTQFALMQAWKNGNYVNDWPPPALGNAATPDGLDRAALEAAVGAAFFPGIEAGGFPANQAKFRDPNNYSAPFRLDHALVSAGDITARMALPWQADFKACGTNWWPVPRPNEVIVPASGGYESWDRGVGNMEAMAAQWHTLGFVVKQGAQYVEAERCGQTAITLVTPVLDFGDVPQKPLGAVNTLALAATFEVSSTGGPVTLQFQGSPTDASFTNVSPPQTVGPTSGNDIAVVRLWVKYSTGNVNDVDLGTVTVVEPASGQTWTIALAARTVARQTAAVALVLDRSGSMTEDRGDGTSKIASLREASEIFVQLMQQGDGVSITRYNQDAQLLRPVTVLGDPTDPFDAARGDILGVLGGPDLNPAGATSIGDGIFEGRQALNNAGAGFANKAMVVLTDGKENRDRFIADVAALINHQTFSIGLGTAANTSAAALQTISGNSGGYLLITGAIDTNNRFLLSKYFVQILAGISNAEIVLDPDGLLLPGMPQMIPVQVTEQDAVLEVVLLTPAPKAVTFLLRTPTGQLIAPGSMAQFGGIQFVAGRGVAYYRVALPTELTPQRFDHAGTWQVVLLFGKRGGQASTGERAALAQTHAAAGTAARGLPFSVSVHAYSNISLRTTVNQASLAPGAEVTITATALESGIPLERGVTAWAEVTAPDRTAQRVALRAGGGTARGAFRADQVGTYRVRVRATGSSSRGNAFQRERTHTAMTVVGGGAPGLGDPPGRSPADKLCELLACLLGPGHAVSAELERTLRRHGVNLAALRKCLAHTCKRRDDGETDATAAARPQVSAELIAQLGALVQRFSADGDEATSS